MAVGVRGQFRHQRYAAQMPRSAISKQLKPEALIHVDKQQFENLAERLQTISSIMKTFQDVGDIQGVSDLSWQRALKQ